MRRLLPAALALALAACSRDLELPTESPPRVDTVAVVGLEPQAVTTGLPVLGGEMVAIRGGGFSDDVAELEVRMGGVDAEVLDAAPDRIVARVPALAAFGPVDVQVRTSIGFRTQSGALRYDGAGQPLGFGVSDLPTSVQLGFVAPVQPPGSYGFSDLAIATGASDSALLVVPAAGVAVTTIPLGIVPISAAARFVVDPLGNFEIQVLAIGRGGAAALGTAVLDNEVSLVNRVQARALTSQVSPAPCTTPQVLFTYGGTPGGEPIPVAAWIEEGPPGTFQQKIATIDAVAATATPGELVPLGTPWPVGGAIVGWAPWGTDSVVFATSSLSGGPGEIWVYDAATQTPPTPLTFVPGGGIGVPVPVSTHLSTLCPAAGPPFFYTLSAATTGSSEALAVGYRAGVTDRVALVDVTAGTVNVGIAGTIPTSLALVPDPPFATPTSWTALAAGITNLYRFRPLTGAPACQSLVPDAALPLSSTPGALPTFGGMAAAANGTRVLSTTPDFDLITVLPPSLTSAGPVARFASYGGLSIQQATIGGASIPIAVAEHATPEGAFSSLDTGSALLVVSLAADGGAVALGGSGYGRGAVWLDGPGNGSSLAYTGDLPKTGLAGPNRGGAAAVTGFSAGLCPGEDVRVTGSRPVSNGPDLMAQGPARAGELGPAGVARFGPAAPPVYAVKGTSLAVYVPDPANLDCLAGTDPDWATTVCAPDATLELGVEPLDVTLSAGDRAAAVRSLDAACVDASTVPLDATCQPSDLVCLRASCPPASQLLVVQADPASATTVLLALPSPPAAVAADRGGGFLVTLPCEDGGGAGGECFRIDTLCDQLPASGEGADGALLLVAEDGSGVECLAVLPALAGPVAVTPNGLEAWVTSTRGGAQLLSRLALPRRTSDGAIDPTLPVTRSAFEHLGTATGGGGAFPPGGLSFTPDGSTGIVTVPGEFRILLYQ